MSFGQRFRQQIPWFTTGNPESEDSATLYAPGMLGCIAEFDQGGLAGPMNVLTYQLVKQASGVTSVVGNVMYWSSKPAFSVTTTATNTGLLAGIAQVISALAANYIWVVKRGRRNVLGIDSLTSAADATGKPAVGVTATAGKADTLALATAPQPIQIGRAVGAQDGTSKLFSCDIAIAD